MILLLNLPCEKATGITKQFRRQNTVVGVTRHIFPGLGADVCPTTPVATHRLALCIPRKFIPAPSTPRIIKVRGRLFFPEIRGRITVQLSDQASLGTFLPDTCRNCCML